MSAYTWHSDGWMELIPFSHTLLLIGLEYINMTMHTCIVRVWAIIQTKYQIPKVKAEETKIPETEGRK